MPIQLIIIALLVLPISLHAQTCYYLIDTAGNTIYADKAPPYSLAHPPVDDPRRDASRQRGEHLVIGRDRICSVGAQTPAQRPSSPTQHTSPPPTFSNTPSYSPSAPNAPYTQQRPRLDPEKLRIAEERLAAIRRNSPTSPPTPSAARPADRFALILNEPRAFQAIIAESIPGFVLAYGIVWLGFWLAHRRQVHLGVRGQILGLSITIFGSSLIRLAGFITVPGVRAYDPPIETGELGIWVLIIPGVIALIYMYLYSRGRSAKVAIPEASVSSSLQGLAARELERGNVEPAIWETAQQIGKNDKAKTEGAYVALRVAQLEQLRDKRAEHPSKPEAAEVQPTPLSGDRGFLPRLLDGEVTLAKTFWLFWFLPVLVFTVFLRAFIEPIPSPPVIATALVFFAIYKMVALRAVWLASARYNGPRVWRFLARLTVVLGVAGVIYDIAVIFELIGIS